MNRSKDIKSRIQEIRNLTLDDSSFDVEMLENLADLFCEVFQNQGKIAFIGNGGSAAEAMHISAEFSGKCVIDHAPLPVICLNDSQSAITAIANDYGVESIFLRQVQSILRKGDVLVALSTSGKSKNILAALEEANKLGALTVLWSGSCEKPPFVNFHLQVFSNSTPRIQEVHLMWGHILAEIIESAY